jgi:transposase, IS5 family
VAKRKGVERGRKVRIDATVVESDIHAPTDSTLLYDGVRVLPSLPRSILLAKSISSSRTGWHGSCQVAISHA